MVALEALGNGILYGLLLALLVGPVFFALIQTSIEKGFPSGVGMALGIAFSDAMYVIIASLGVAVLANNQDFQMWLGWAGGLIMFFFGLVNLLKKVRARNEQQVMKPSGNLFRQFIKGFLLNGVNPFVLLFWIGVASMVTLQYQYPLKLKALFFGAVLLTVLLLDFAKAYAANRLRKILSPRFMTWMNRIVGIVLVLFSFQLFYFAYEAML